MIQASQPKPIETKAPERVDVANKAHKASKNSKESSKTNEASEFSKKLETAGQETETEAKVLPVQVSEEQKLQMPSSLVQDAANVDSISPKVFDPALTKGVEALIQPKTTAVDANAEVPVVLTDAEVLELANPETSKVKGEILQAMLKTPQVQSGRAPAIEFAQTEVDPQLLNLEDFVSQKNLMTKKAAPDAYGMKLGVQQQVALENGLKQTEVVKDISALESPAMNSQQFILNSLAEQNTNAQTQETASVSKVFDMSQIKSSNTNEIMSQITDYVAQAKVAKEPTVNMRVNHQELGMIDITVSKSGINNEAIAINIGAHSVDGKNFFQQNSKDLISHLSSAGMTVSDMKVETPNQTAKNEFDFGSQSGKNQQGSDKQFGSEQNQRRHEQERRQDLWKLLNQEAA